MPSSKFDNISKIVCSRSCSRDRPTQFLIKPVVRALLKFIITLYSHSRWVKVNFIYFKNIFGNALRDKKSFWVSFQTNLPQRWKIFFQVSVKNNKLNNLETKSFGKLTSRAPFWHIICILFIKFEIWTFFYLFSSFLISNDLKWPRD